MEELYTLIRSLAESIEEEPMELVAAVDLKDQEYREAVVSSGTPPSHAAVEQQPPYLRMPVSIEGAVPDKQQPFSGFPATPLPRTPLSADPALPYGRNPVQIPVAPIQTHQPESGPGASVFSPVQVAGATATVFAKQGYAGPEAEPSRGVRYTSQSITPDINVRTAIPVDFPIDAAKLFQVADQRAGHTFQDIAVVKDQDPFESTWNSLVESSEELVARVYQDEVSTVEEQSERMIYPS